MAFTTWTDLLTAMRDDLASGRWRRKSYTIGDARVEYTSIQEFLDGLRWVESRAAIESGGFRARTYAKNGGRG